MNRREFGKGAVLSAIAGLLGIGAKVVEPEAAVLEGPWVNVPGPYHGSTFSINGMLVAGEGAKTTLAPGLLVSKELLADSAVDIGGWIRDPWNCTTLTGFVAEWGE